MHYSLLTYHILNKLPVYEKPTDLRRHLRYVRRMKTLSLWFAFSLACQLQIFPLSGWSLRKLHDNLHLWFICQEERGKKKVFKQLYIRDIFDFHFHLKIAQMGFIYRLTPDF